MHTLAIHIKNFPENLKCTEFYNNLDEHASIIHEFQDQIIIIINLDDRMSIDILKNYTHNYLIHHNVYDFQFSCSNNINSTIVTTLKFSEEQKFYYDRSKHIIIKRFKSK